MSDLLGVLRIKDSNGNWVSVPGLKGDTGEPFKILGIYATAAALEADVEDPGIGDVYLVGTVGAYDIYLYLADGWHNTGRYMPKGDTGDPAPAASITSAVETWLAANVDPETGYVLDRTLTQENAAAPADLVGKLESAITELDGAVYGEVDNTFPIAFENGTYLYTTTGQALEKYYGGGYDTTRKVVKSTVFNAPCNVRITAKTGYSFTVFTSENGVITGNSGLVTEYTMFSGRQYGMTLRAADGTDDISAIAVSSIVDIEYISNIEELESDIDEVWNGNNGVTVFTQSELIAKYGLYSRSTLYFAADRIVGQTFPSGVDSLASTNAYAVLIDISDFISFTYPKFKNASGYGCLLLDEDMKVTRNLPCISDSTGTMATIIVLPNEKYFVFGSNASLAGMTWTFTITKEATKGISELAEDVSNVEEDVTDNANNIARLQAEVFPSPQLNAEIVGFICYGQSWSMGYDTNAIVSAQRYDNIMLDSGLMNNPASDLPVSASSFSPLTESTVWATSEQTTKCGETPCTAQTDIIKQLLLSENGYNTSDIKYQIFSAAPGYGNRSLEELSYGTDYYNRLIAVVTAANSIARAQGKAFAVPAISWAQGRATTGDATYYDQLEELRAHLDADIKAITGQTIPVKMIVWQAVFGNTTPKRFYDRYVYASEKYENIICSGTFYHLNHVANNNLHLTANSQDLLGCQFGIAYKRSIIDGNKFIPLKPKKAEVYGNIVYVDFDVPVKPLVFDTTLVASNTNYGFQIFDSSNVEKTISAVEIIAPDKIKIVCASDVATTDHIVYGGNGGSDYSPTTGKRGNLRDSQNIVYKNHNNIEMPCYNWCVVFDKTIAELTGTN